MQPRPVPSVRTLVLVLGSLTAFGPLSIDMYLPATTRLMRQRMPEQVMATALGILVVSGTILLITAWLQLSLGFLLVPLFIFISSLGITLPNTTAAALASEGARAGSASALLGTLQFGCAAVASAAVSVFDNGTAIPMAAVIAVCGWGSFLMAWRTRRVQLLTAPVDSL